MSSRYAIFYLLYHYKLPFGVYAYTFDTCTNKVYLLTYLDEAGCSRAATKQNLKVIAD